MRTHRIHALFVVLFGFHLLACGPNAKQKTLTTTLTGLNAARDGFIAWDNTHQQNIVKKATSLADGQAKLKTYRAKRAKLEAGFAVAYKAVATAALDLKQENLLIALSAVVELYADIRALLGTDADTVVPKDTGKK
jgi:hypothetical protein